MTNANLHALFFSQRQLNLPPFPNEVRGPSICRGHLYGLASRDDVDRAEVIVVTIAGAVTGRADLPGWEDAPGRVIIVASKRNAELFKAMLGTLVTLRGICCTHEATFITPGERACTADDLRRRLERLCGDEPLAAIVVDHPDLIARGYTPGVGDPSTERFRPLTEINGKPVAVVVSSEPDRGLGHPVIVTELKPMRRRVMSDAAQQQPATRQEQLFESVCATLGEVSDADGPGVAYSIAEGNIRASAWFLLDQIGPMAARRVLAATMADLEVEIRLNNHGSEIIQ